MTSNINNEEDREQIALFEWAEYKHLDMIFHIPNGSNKSISQAVKFKRMGLKSGVPDIFLAIPMNGFHGLFIERKAKKGVISPTQKEWLKRLNEQGYRAVVAKGFEEAVKVIEEYLWNR